MESIFKVKNYEKTTWNEETQKTTAIKKEGDINVIAKLIKQSDKGYHIRLHSSKPCIVFGDVDHYENEELFNELLNELTKYFEIDKNEISYTLCKKSDNEYSYHFSIPTIETDFYTLKYIFNNKEGRFYQYKVDLSVYCNKWFRLPNQTNENKPLKHNIIQGTEADFIVHNVNKIDYKFIEKQIINEIINDDKPQLSNKKDNNDIYKVLDNLNIKRFDNYNDWLYLHMIFINEKLDLNILKSYCKKSSKYNEEANNKIIKHIKPNKGLTLKTLYYWLKQDNINEFNNLVQYNNLFFDSSLINNKDIAELYYNMNPYQFIYNKNLGWYMYNDNNILLEYGQNAPSLLLNDIASKIHDWLNSLKNSINLSDDAKTEKFKMISKAYTKIGMSTFIKGCIDFLKNLYNVEKLEDKIDSNKNVIAFENILYDLEIGSFRKIKYDDYIIKNTKYNINIESNKEIRNKINDLLYSIFENNNVINFWKISTALSIFGRSFESLYIHTGTGRNGKGVLSTLLKSLLGDYFLSTDNTFLTTVFKSGQANSALAQSKGVRFLLVSEPDTGAAECSLNIDFVKSMTGGDEISARDLYAKATTFKPFFSLLLQCNQKPKLSKIDKAMEERLKIIHYPFTFVDNPTNPEERKKDNNLKDLITDKDFINEFILMLLEVANENKNIKYVELPEEVKQQNKEYIEENNNILTFINENYEITKDIKDKIKSSDLLIAYNSYNDVKIDSRKLKQMMEYNRFKFIKNRDGNYYTNLKLKIDDDINDTYDLDM